MWCQILFPHVFGRAQSITRHSASFLEVLETRLAHVSFFDVVKGNSRVD